jgi:hypothetical protein
VLTPSRSPERNCLTQAPVELALGFKFSAASEEAA